MTDKQAFRVTVESPFGMQPIEQFEHFIHKIESESRERWGIEITIERVDS